MAVQFDKGVILGELLKYPHFTDEALAHHSRALQVPIVEQQLGHILPTE